MQDIAIADLIVVTGAGRGIGRSIALALAEAGAHVLCISQTYRAEETAAEIHRLGGKASAIVGDLANYLDIQKRVQEWVSASKWNRIGIVLAAATLGPNVPLAISSLEEWDQTYRTNVLGNLAIVQALLPRQLENRYGRILFFAGGGAAYAYPNFPAYAASKTALVRIVENLHEDLRHKGDFATVILAPGAVETDTLAAVRASGGYVRTTVDIGEPTAFAKAFLSSSRCPFSGCFVHVRDSWAELLNSTHDLKSGDMWKLRRVE